MTVAVAFLVEAREKIPKADIDRARLLEQLAQFFMSSALFCPIRREQIILADAEQRFICASVADHCAGVVNADDASFELTLWEILEANVPERQIKLGGHGSRLATALQAVSWPRSFMATDRKPPEPNSFLGDRHDGAVLNGCCDLAPNSDE